MMNHEPVNWWNIALEEDEIEAVGQAIRDRFVSMGPLTEKLEEALARELEVPYVVCVTSGTSALMIACMAAGVRAGDEVIVPDRTFVATAHAPMILGARVRLTDTKKSRPVMDENALAPLITDRTRAIIPVHLNGHAADMEAINAIASRHGITVIEDACQAFGSRSNGRLLGTLSRFGCFSLGLAKLVTTGQGGFVTCHTQEDRELLKKLRNHGVFDVFHDGGPCMVGGNFKLTDIQASIGLVQIGKFERKRRHQLDVYRRYRDGLSDVACLRCVNVDIENGELPLRPEFLCSDREAFIKEINRFGINVVAHTHSLNELPYLNTPGASFPNSELHHAHALIFPCGPDQPIANVERSINAIKEIAGAFPAWQD